MTPAQVAHIMSLVTDYAAAVRGRLNFEQVEAAYAKYKAVEAALRDAPQQAEGWVMVPVDVLKAASESLGSFVSDHGWGDADMQAMDNLDAYLAARPSAPTAVEPRPCKVGGPCVATASSPCACRDLQRPQRPQNCGTGFCSCIECPYEPSTEASEPVGEREAFEVWAEREGYEIKSLKPDGRYWSSHTHGVWEAWQASAANSTKGSQ